MRTIVALSSVMVIGMVAACGHPPPAETGPKIEMVTITPTPRIDCDAFLAADAPAPPPASQDVAPDVLEGHRVAGSTTITPPDGERDRLPPGSRWIASARMCIDGHGEVSRLDSLQRSGLPGWDRRLCEQMQQWRYTPYVVDGQPVAACTAVTFIYQIHDPKAQASAP